MAAVLATVNSVAPQKAVLPVASQDLGCWSWSYRVVGGVPRRAVADLAGVIRKVTKSRSIRRRIARNVSASRRWNRVLVADAVLLSRGLIVTKEEQLVLDDRAAYGSAELLPAGRRNKPICTRVCLELGKRVARRQGIGAPEPESASVQVVASGLSLDRDHPGHSFAELGVIILQRDLAFP